MAGAARGQALVLNEQTSPKQKSINYMLGFLGIGYFSILFAAAWTPECVFMQWFNNFNQFVLVEHHFLVGFTKMTGKTFALCEAVWTLGYLYFVTKIQHPFAGREHGDAKWGDPKTFSRFYANSDPKNLVTVKFGEDVKPPAKPMVVNTHNYWLADGIFVNIDNKLTSNLNILVVGPPGTGKSFRLSRPVLSQLSGNFLVTDPKGGAGRSVVKSYGTVTAGFQNLTFE